MESTSCGKECPFVKQGFCGSEKECPNYVESWWIADNEQPRKLEDCSPKRLVLQQQYMQSRLEGVQGALEESRNMYNELCGHLKTLIEMSKTVISRDVTTKNLEIEHAKHMPSIASDSFDM